jgi:hypothetical protein
MLRASGFAFGPLRPMVKCSAKWAFGWDRRKVRSGLGKVFPCGCAVVAREKKRSVRKNGACR